MLDFIRIQSIRKQKTSPWLRSATSNYLRSISSPAIIRRIIHPGRAGGLSTVTASAHLSTRLHPGSWWLRASVRPNVVPNKSQLLRKKVAKNPHVIYVGIARISRLPSRSWRSREYEGLTGVTIVPLALLRPPDMQPQQDRRQ